MKDDTQKKLKDTSELLRTVVGKERERSTAAIIVAAGSSTRMKSDVPKVFMPLCGMPVLVHTLKAFSASPYISLIIVVCRKGDEKTVEEYKEKYGLDKLVKIVPGGSTRQESVLCGIEAAEQYKEIRYVAIADGARPLCTPAMINESCLAAYRFGAATAAFRATDTVKIAAKHDFIESTPDRETVWNAVTPQVFDLNVYRAAAYSALEGGFVTTDDNALVEHIDRQVKLVDVGPYNIKITRPEDLIIAEALYRSRYSDDSSESSDSE